MEQVVFYFQRNLSNIYHHLLPIDNFTLYTNKWSTLNNGTSLARNEQVLCCTVKTDTPTPRAAPAISQK